MKTLNVFILTLSILLSVPVRAATPNLCPDDLKHAGELLKACDGALQKCAKANQDKQAENDALKDETEAQRKRIADLESSQNDILNNKILWIAVGAVFTGLIVHFSGH